MKAAQTLVFPALTRDLRRVLFTYIFERGSVWTSPMLLWSGAARIVHTTQLKLLDDLPCSHGRTRGARWIGLQTTSYVADPPEGLRADAEVLHGVVSAEEHRSNVETARALLLYARSFPPRLREPAAEG